MICMETHKTLKSQSNFEKVEWNQQSQTLISNYTTRILREYETCTNIEIQTNGTNYKVQDKFIHPLSLTMEAKICNRKRFSSKHVTGKTGQLCVEIRTLSNIMFKNKLKMHYRCKCKTRKYKTLRVKHRYNHPKIRHSKILYYPLLE